MRHIPLTRGKYAIVDDSVHEKLRRLGPWKALKVGQTFYAYNHRHGYMHRVILGRSHAACVDHRDGNGLNNQRSNLRPATKQQNGTNRGRNKNNTSGYKGVAYYHKSNCWRAQICVLRRQHFLGYFRFKTHAARAYNDAARHFFGKYAWLNPVRVR